MKNHHEFFQIFWSNSYGNIKYLVTPFFSMYFKWAIFRNLILLPFYFLKIVGPSQKIWKNSWNIIFIWTITMNFFRFFGAILTKNIKSSVELIFPMYFKWPFKINREKLCYRIFYISIRMAPKNLKKFMMIFHHKICFHAFFRMSKGNSTL